MNELTTELKNLYQDTLNNLKISKSNNETTIAVRAYYGRAYESMSLWAFTGLVGKKF